MVRHQRLGHLAKNVRQGMGTGDTICGISCGMREGMGGNATEMGSGMGRKGVVGNGLGVQGINNRIDATSGATCQENAVRA